MSRSVVVSLQAESEIETIDSWWRILLRATRHHMYYVATDEVVVVLAVWGSVKGAGPDLTGIE